MSEKNYNFVCEKFNDDGERCSYKSNRSDNFKRHDEEVHLKRKSKCEKCGLVMTKNIATPSQKKSMHAC